MSKARKVHRLPRHSYYHMLRDYRKEAENPETPADLVEHGKSRALAGMYDVAIQSFRKAIEKQPDYAEAHFGLACACCAVGEQEEAEAEFRKALELDPVHARAHGELGYCHLVCGRLDDAIAELQRAVEADPGTAAGSLPARAGIPA